MLFRNEIITKSSLSVHAVREKVHGALFEPAYSQSDKMQSMTKYQRTLVVKCAAIYFLSAAKSFEIEAEEANNVFIQLN
jgi:hypothetical protein